MTERETEDLIEKMKPMAMRLARRFMFHGVDGEGADDCESAAMLGLMKAAQNLHLMRDPNPKTVKQYFATTVANYLKMYYRKEKRRWRLREDANETFVLTHALEPISTDRLVDGKLLNGQVAKLSELRRRIIQLHYVEDIKLRDVARALGTNYTAIFREHAATIRVLRKRVNVRKIVPVAWAPPPAAEPPPQTIQETQARRVRRKKQREKPQEQPRVVAFYRPPLQIVDVFMDAFELMPEEFTKRQFTIALHRFVGRNLRLVEIREAFSMLGRLGYATAVDHRRFRRWDSGEDVQRVANSR